MTYFPYFRGKQYELITIRECAEIFHSSGFVPIIEPVKHQLSSLSKTIDEVLAKGAGIIVIANPRVGNFATQNAELVQLIDSKNKKDNPITVGIMLNEATTLDQVKAKIVQFEGHNIALIHSGFSQSRALAEAIKDKAHIDCSIFEDGKSGKQYQTHFSFQNHKILLKDGFEKRRNADHPDVEVFSDLHITFNQEGMVGFADYLIVGDNYQESGGPAHTVAIHLTFINDDDDDIMYVRHFKSIRQDTPTDPAGKFAEALDTLITHLNSPENKFYETSAISELIELNDKKHFPGLGYVKKLAMKHHVETFARYFRENPAE